MSLDPDKLRENILNAFVEGEASNIDTIETTASEIKNYTKQRQELIAGMIADAISEYAKEAEIKLLPGPFMMPNPATTPPLIPDTVNIGKTISLASDVQNAGKSILKAGFSSSFAASDPSMAAAMASVVTYAASLIAFGSASPGTAFGSVLMPSPPALGTAVSLGKSTNLSKEKIALSLSSAIHVSFFSSIFTGTGMTSSGGGGPVTFKLS